MSNHSLFGILTGAALFLAPLSARAEVGVVTFVTATSSNPAILPNENIQTRVEGASLVVTLETLPDQGGEVELSFSAVIDGAITHLQPVWVELPILRIETISGYVLIHWEGTGVLQERADLASGTWADVSHDSSRPFVANWDPDAAMKVYRVVR